jgi:hypothetical protein
VAINPTFSLLVVFAAWHTDTMGCGNSKDDVAATPAARQPGAQSPRKQSTASASRPIDASSAVVVGGTPDAPRAVVASPSESKRDALLLFGTSTDRRNIEVEVFSGIVQKANEYVECDARRALVAPRWVPSVGACRPLSLPVTPALPCDRVGGWVSCALRSDFIDVSHSAADFAVEDGASNSDAAFLARIRTTAVLPELVDVATIPRASARNQDSLRLLLQRPALTQEQLAEVNSVCAALASAARDTSFDDKGLQMVVQFTAAG